MDELRPKGEELLASRKGSGRVEQGEWSRVEEVSGIVRSKESIMFPHGP